MRTRVKICGLTRSEDAIECAKAGADAIGLVFYPPSPRNLSIEQAKTIASATPAFVTKTALFVNPTVEEVEAVLAEVPIDLLQFHGDESAEFCRQFGRSYIKAVSMKPDIDLLAIAEDYSDSSGILLDTYKKGVPGGTGESFNWQLVPENYPKPIILAGGLTPGNAHEAINQTEPWALDVSGGVEVQKGVKSPEKIREFMSAVNALAKP